MAFDSYFSGTDMIIQLVAISAILISQLTLIHGQKDNAFLDAVERANKLFFRGNDSIVDVQDFLPVYDFIIVGSGSGGSVVANRLTENPNWKVLLLEAGREETFLTDVPLAAGLGSATGYNWGYKTDAGTQNACLSLLNGVCHWPKGRVLGGTSVLNFMIHTKGHKYDYDYWSYLGNKGWSYEEVLPYFMKTENVKIPEFRNSQYRGKSGYVDIENARFVSKLHKSFIQAGKYLGYKYRDPNNDLAKMMGFSRAQTTTRNGMRCSAAKAYLRSVSHRKNLHISLKSYVVKVAIDPATSKAVGVEFIKNKRRYFVRAKKEVILSAGTIGSAQILMLSGIGPRENLKKFGIPVYANLKVGYNLQDHQSLTILPFIVNQPVTLTEKEMRRPRHLLNYILHREGPLTLPSGAEGIAFMKTNISYTPKNYPDIELVMGLLSPTAITPKFVREGLGFTDEFYDKVFWNTAHKSGYTITPVLLKPKSRGRIFLKSADPFLWPHIQPNYFSNKDDLVVLREGVKLAIQVGESPAFASFGSKLLSNPFPGCEHFPFRSDSYIECILVNYAFSLNHQVGTCKMGIDKDSVVDPKLRVYGIKNLRVVDGSIMPVIPASHTNSVIYMIGEKASDLIKQTWTNKL